MIHLREKENDKQVRGVLGNKCAGQHNLKRVHPQHWRFRICSGCRRLLTFNRHCCLNNSFNGSAPRSFYKQKRICCIFYFRTIALIFTVLSYDALRICFPIHLVKIMRQKIKEHIEDFCTMQFSVMPQVKQLYITKKFRVLKRKHVVDLMALSL
jgi:hypothetical protein